MIAKSYAQPFDPEHLTHGGCVHAHLVVIAPNVLCRECLCTFPIPLGADLQSPTADADTEGHEPLRLN